MAAPQQGRGAPPGSAGARPEVVVLNPCLTCKLCKGYLVDAMTLVKCLHSFCRSCILKHLETGHACPVCDLRLSKINMESHLVKDDTLQNVVYKAVPGLYQKEMKRRRDFYATKGSKADQASLSPEQKGELDSSSSGRIIFSPDEAVSLSLEYKPIVDVKAEPEASSAGPSSQAFKEPTKRYLNCPAAVTIALLQKFLRMKYSISARYKVDILYMDDVLWSHYMLMDVAYIYSWKRDMPLRLFYRVFESPPKPPAPLASTVRVPTSTPSVAQSKDQQSSGGISACVASGIHARGPTLSKSASVTQESRGCKKETTTPNVPAKPVECASPVSQLAPLKPTDEASGTSIADPKVQSKLDSSPPTRTTNPASVTGISVESKPTKTAATTVPSVAAAQMCSVQRKVPDIPDASKPCTSTTTVPASLTTKGPSEARAVNTVAAPATASPSSTKKPETASEPKESAASSKEANALAPCEPVACPLAKVPPSSMKSVVVESVNREKTTPPVVPVAPSAHQGAGCKPAHVCEPTLTFKASPDSGSSARTAGFVMKYQPKVATPTLNGIDKGIADGLLKSAIRAGDVVCDEVTNNDIVVEDVDARLTCSSLAISPPSLVDSSVEEKMPETKELQTCISRAALKAEEKMNAMKAAAALVKEGGPSEKDGTEASSGGLSITLRPNRISVRSHSDDSADKRPRKTSQGDVSPVGEPPTSKPPCRSVTPPLPVIPSYLTLSKSHPSLFHTSPRKRGRPKLATVNSLNEEIERAHMMARGEMAVAAEKPAHRVEATAEKPKPVIPVITSLKIKPIPPPPPPQHPDVLSSPTAPDVLKDLQLRPRSKSQGDVSEGKSSDTEDSVGRRKSKRKRPPAEQLKTMVSQLKELSMDKVQAVTQEPLQSLSGKGMPKPEQGPEKITLRVTRDEKCILKVEKQLRPAVVSETLHDSGFCEDVVADSLTSSPVPPKLKSIPITATRSAQHTAVRIVSSTTTSKSLEQISATRHLQLGTKRDMRKSKRKSVEDWVNEQSKWVRTHEAEAVKEQDIVPPHAKPDRSCKDAPSVPRVSSESKEASAKGQRRGRKRTNPVKITKPAPAIDTQQDKPVSGPARVSSSSAEVSAMSQPLPAVEKESSGEAGHKVSTHSPRNSGGSRNKQEPLPEHPKKSPELVIPRYIPNAATSVPLTVTHARNKRLRESRQEASAASCLDLTSSPSGRGASTESPEKDSEKSKFFKEALNLSMKEAEVPTASCKDASATSVPQSKHPEEIAGVPCRDVHGAQAATVDDSKTVTKALEQAPPNHGATSQLSIIHQVVEKIASRNSRKLPKSQQEVVDKIPAATKEENQTNCGSGKKCIRQEDSCSSRSPSSGQPGSFGACQDSDKSVKHNTLTSSVGTAVEAKAVSNTVAGPKEMQPSEQSPKSMQACNDPLQTSSVGSEILPRINETGVFRLEFPAAELSAPSELRNSKEESSAVTPSSNSVERQSRGSSSLVGKKMSESLRNIVLVQESMMELRQGSSRSSLGSSVEARAKEYPSAAEKLSSTNSFPPKGKSPTQENRLALNVKKELSSSSNNMFAPSSMHSRPQFPNLQFPVSDMKSVRDIGLVVPPAATCLSEVFTGSSKPCVRSKSAELIVKSPPENRLSPIFGNVPILKIPGTVERESFDPSKLQSSNVRSVRSPVRSPLGLEVKSPSPTAHTSIGSCAVQDKPSPVKSPLATDVKIVNHMGHIPTDMCGASAVQCAPRPVRSPVSMDVSTTSHCISGSSVRATDTKVCKLPQERGLWRPIDICTSQQLTEAALQKIAANKSISIGQVKDRRLQVACRNRPDVVDVAQGPQSLSVSIVTSNAGLKGGYIHQANEITRVSQPLEVLSIPRQSHLSNHQQPDFLVKEALPMPHCLDVTNSKFHGCSTLLLRAHPELSVTSRSDFKSGIHIPASLSVYTSVQQNSNLSPPPCKSTTLPGKERLSPRLSAELEQPRLSPRPSDRVSVRTSAREICQPEGISSSNEVLAAKCGIRKGSGMPSPRASENMYRTTVAEIDLFTTLSIIETMKGRATVHDIIDEYITNIGSFFCIMESLPKEDKHVAEVMCSKKEKALLKVTALLKKVTNKLSSGQLSRALAVEALVRRFLERCGRDHGSTLAAASTSGEEVTSSVSGTSCVVSALCEQNVEDTKDDPTPVVIPGFEFAVVPILDVHLRNAELKRKALKRLRYSLRLRDLVELKRKCASSMILPSEEQVCRRFAPRRSGGWFSHRSAPRQVKKSSFVPQPAASVHLLTKSLARLLSVASFGLPQSTVIARELSSSLTGLSPNLVNCNVPRNGQCCPLGLMQPVMTPAKATSSALQAYREPGSARNVENILSALSLFLSGQLDGATSHVPQVVSHFADDGSVIIPYTRRRRSSDGLHPSRNMLLVEATSDSSLVISSPKSNSKLVIGPDFDRQMLSRLLDGLKFRIPKTQDAANSWLSSVMRGESGQGSGRMLTNHVDTPDQGWLATKAISSVKLELTAQVKQLIRPVLLAKRELLVKPKVPLSRRLLQKRGAPATGACEVSPVQKRRRSAGALVPGVVVEVRSATAHRQRLVNAHPTRKDMGEVVPKDCVVVLQRLELRNIEETILKKRHDSGGARPKKKPKLSLLPKAPSCVER